MAFQHDSAGPCATPAYGGYRDLCAKDHDRAQFIDALYRDHHQDLLRYLRRRCGAGFPEAEDLVQAAFVRIARLRRVDDIKNPRAFLFKVAINLALTAVADRVRSRRVLRRLSREAEISRTGAEGFAESAFRAQCADLNRSMAQLTDKQRELIIRCRIRGETYHEISADTGWSPADISRSLNQAVTALGSAVNGALV